MEGKRDVALALYENLGDQEKADIHNDFKRETANGSVYEYIKRHYETDPGKADAWLQTCKGYQEGSLDFNDFITIKYIMENVVTPRCDGCSSLIVKPYFSCWNCRIDPYSEDTYDLCIDCYRSKKYKDHNHHIFKDDQTMLYSALWVLAKEIRDRDARFDELKQSRSTEPQAALLPENQGVHHRIDLLGERASVVFLPRNQDTSSPFSFYPESDEEKNSVDILRPQEFERLNPKRINDLVGAMASVLNEPKNSDSS